MQIATLTLLESLVTRYTHGGLQGDGMRKAVAETPALISEHDLQISQLAMRFTTGEWGFSHLECSSMNTLFLPSFSHLP